MMSEIALRASQSEPAPQKEISNKRLLALNAIRFFLCLAIFLFHSDYLSWYGSPDPGIAWLYKNVFFCGQLAVVVFFVLSAFVITYSYREKFKTITLANYGIFVWRRFIKVYPLYFVTMAIAALRLYADTGWNPAWWGENWKQIVLSITLLQSVFNEYASIFNFPCWFVSAIFFLYLVTPFLLWASHKIPQKKWWIYLVIIFVSYGIFVGLSYLFNFVLYPIHQTRFFETFTFNSPFARFFQFVPGVAIGCLYLQFRGKLKLGKWVFTGLEFGAIALYLAAHFIELHLLPEPDMLPQREYLSLPIALVFVFVFAFDGGLVSKVLSFRVFQTLGDISMAIYMLHYLFYYYGLPQYWYGVMSGGGAVYAGICSWLMWFITCAVLAYGVTKLQNYLLSLKKHKPTKAAQEY